MAKIALTGSLLPLVCMLAGAPATAGTLTLTQKQTDYRVASERVTQRVSLCGDKFDSYCDFLITGRSGSVQINIPIGPKGQAEYVSTPGGRALPISFDCDYSSGAVTRGTVSVRYRHPRNLYGTVSGDVEAVCIPLTPEESANQKQKEDELAKQQALAQEKATADQSRREEEQRRRAEAAAEDARKRAAERATRAEEERRKETEFIAQQQKSKPACTDVTVTGLIASSVRDVEALHAEHLSPSELEDVLARHPYSCQINSFGVAFGCRGGAFVKGRSATVKNWTPTHYVIEIPLDFQVGRRDAPAWVRRSEVRCRR